MVTKSRTDDILWKMLESEMGMPEVVELQGYLNGNGDADHFEMGYGELVIEPYDTRGGRSRMFRVRHPKYGETTVSHSAMLSVLHDLAHALRR
ncbi:MAG: hypothetical protein H7X80_01475 [bacterium]|nr:hypothetical protein [Candidatus Kapabacteria bacterium]